MPPAAAETLLAGKIQSAQAVDQRSRAKTVGPPQVS